MLAAVVEPYTAGLELSAELLTGPFQLAVDEGRILGTIDGALRGFVERRSPVRVAALGTDLLKALAAWLATATTGNVTAAQLTSDETFLRAFRRLFLRAQRGGWETTRWVAAVAALLKRFAFGGSIGAALASFLFSALVAPYFEDARDDWRKEPAIRDLIPYLMYWTRDDGKVRMAHQALHMFAARQDWQGWEREVMPPQGWRCRCRMIDIPWNVARDRGWGGTFPQGDAKLKAFRKAGGTDARFPRELFVVGALSSTQ